MGSTASITKIVTLFGILLCFFSRLGAQSNEEIFNKMFDAIDNVKTLKYSLYSIERIDDAFSTGHCFVKLNVSPFKVYYKSIEKGVEVLLVDGDALINPNGFPYVTLHLSPTGKLMRKGQHQTMARLGYTYFGDMLSHSLAKFPDAYKNYVHRLADTSWDNTPCYKVEINFTQYTNVPYIVTQSGLTASKIATQNFLNDYEVLTLNNISWYEDDLEIGQKLTLPAAYAKHVVLLVSKETNLPLVIRVYDDKGLYEMYQYTNLHVNPTIPDAEFTQDYPGYHF